MYVDGVLEHWTINYKQKFLRIFHQTFGESYYYSFVFSKNVTHGIFSLKNMDKTFYHNDELVGYRGSHSSTETAQVEAVPV